VLPYENAASSRAKQLSAQHCAGTAILIRAASLTSRDGAASGRIGYNQPSFAFLLNAPSLIAIVLIVGYPIAYSAWVSLHDYNLKRPRRFDFVGLGNYQEIFSSPEYWSALWITLEFIALSVSVLVVLGVLIALLLSRPFPGCGLLRTLILVPWAIPPVVNGLMWQWIYDPKVGALNGLLLGLGVISEYQGWLSQPIYALLALVSAHVWNMLPLAVILLLAALQRIPGDLYDAARVDGCTRHQLFWHVTFPWLTQPLLIVLILQTMFAIRAFDVIYVLTAGGPGTSTTTLTWKTYLVTFESLDFGLGNAYAYTVSLITLVLALIYFQLLYHRGEFES
jgi:multiple sugar transport system permease protein